MALSQIIKETCPKCGKVAIEVSRSQLFTSKMIKLACGHVVAEGSLIGSEFDYSSIVSSDGKSLRPYQIEGIKFIERGDARVILADEQGLGKMIQTLAVIKLHREKLTPALIVCPTSIKAQWLDQIVRWCGMEGFATQIIMSGKDIALPGFNVYITTYDILKKEPIWALLDDISFLVLDECQKIKNHLSDRAKAVQRIVKDKNIKHILPTSGTPIKNHAGEYYTVLNLVKPQIYNNYDKFIREECDSYENGWGYKIGGLRDTEGFREKTKDFILRRTKAEVLSDLPEKSRNFHHVDLDRKFNKAYAAALDELEEVLYGEESEFAKSSATIAIMSKLRHITGISKVTEVVEFATDFLLSTERKLVIFVHHIDVGHLIIEKLNAWCLDGGYDRPLALHSGLNGEQRAALVKQFKDSNSRIMVASTLAAGEGLNLQFCSDAVILERQWNPANEEQAEDRFHRFGQENKVSITYMIASGTIDEYFTELVEAKRAIVAGALDGKEIKWDEASLMKELATVLVTKGRKKWSL